MARRGDRRPHDPDPPLSAGPFTEITYPDLDVDANEMRSGHHSAPGLRDENVPRQGLSSPGNGEPGVPKVRTTRIGVRGGIVGTFAGSPMQPGVTYDGEDEDF